MWKNFVEWGRQQMRIWRVCIACWVTEATNTHSEYVTVIPFPLQHGCASASHRCLCSQPHCLHVCRPADWRKMADCRPPHAAVPLACWLCERTNSVRSSWLLAGYSAACSFIVWRNKCRSSLHVGPPIARTSIPQCGFVAPGKCDQNAPP